MTNTAGEAITKSGHYVSSCISCIT